MPATKSRPGKNPAHTAYERALKLLYKGDYAKAQTAFQALVEKFPDEKELSARAGLLIRLCEVRTSKPRKKKQDGLELYDSGIVEHNRGRFDKAVDYYEESLPRVDGKTDKGAVYAAMAASLARAGDSDRSVECLKKAIEADEVHRYHAQHDPDFESLNSNDEFKQITGGSRSG